MAQSVSPQELLRQLQIIGAVVGNHRLPTTVPTAAALQTQTSQPNTVPVFTYKAKIINPTKKSKVVVRLVNFTTKFDSITAMRVRFVEQFQEQVPNTMDFKVRILWRPTGKSIFNYIRRFKCNVPTASNWWADNPVV